MLIRICYLPFTVLGIRRFNQLLTFLTAGIASQCHVSKSVTVGGSVGVSTDGVTEADVTVSC